MDDLQERLDRSFDDGPPLGRIEDALRLGRRAQRRRRLGTAAAGVAVVTATAAGGAALAQLHTDPDRDATATPPAGQVDRGDHDPDRHPDGTRITPPPGATNADDLPRGPLPSTPAEFAEACAHATESSSRQDRLVFGADDPTLMAHATGSRAAFALYRSADASHWGRCEVTKVGDANMSTMSVYGDTGSRSRAPGATMTDCLAGCPVQHSFVGVLPAVVDAVRVVYTDGMTETEHTNDGFVALVHTVSKARGGGERLDAVLRRIQYLADDGSVLAEYAATGVTPTPGAPALEAYPALDDTTPLGYDEESGNYQD